jgi:hypothetical protein
MRFKTLLLGSATAFAFAGGAAQAADLSVAEPVDYVRVCDAFGAGYWYIPGTDTCLRLGGEVKFKVQFFEEDDLYSDHTGSWDFTTSWDFDVTTKSMTDWGPLTTYFKMSGESVEGGNAVSVTTEEYYLSLGPVLLGSTASAFDIVGGGYTEEDFKLSDNTVDQIQLSWAINGFGLVVAIEAPSDRWDTHELNDMPDLVAALTAGGTGWDAGVSFLYADLDGGDALWAVQGKLELDVWGDQLLLGAMYVDDGGVDHHSGWGAYGGDQAGGLENGYSVLVSYQHNWSSNLYSAATFAYWNDDNHSDDGWDAAFTTAFSPAEGLWVGGDISTDEDSAWLVVLFATREFGG